MDTRRRPPKPRRPTSSQDGGGHHLHQKRLPPTIDNSSPSSPPKASDALPLPLYLTNAIFFTLFFSVAYYLLYRWRDKIRNSTPLHVVTFPEIAAIISLTASFIYLLGFFGIDFVQSFITRSSHDAWELEGSHNPNFLINKDHRLVTCPPPSSIDPIPKLPNPETIITPLASVEDEEIVKSVTEGTLPSYSLETKLGDCKRAAVIRREALQRTTGRSLEGLPIEGFDYDSILGQCCEMPVGYVQIPVGIAGPLSLNGMEFMVPMATTEGCLVASTNRGCKAIYASGGASSVLYADGMTRAPVVRFETAKRASELKLFLEDPDNFDTLSTVFNRSSRFGRLQGIQCAMAGKNLYIRFKCSTGDAMGMNMVSKGVQNVLDFLQADFPDMEVIGISGNYCSDKKPAAVNWIGGRGKSVVCEAIIKEEIVKKVLKTSVASLVELNMLKNLAGSAIAGALGGFNAHASNVVSAIFIATGQDPAQNVESSNCITMMEAVNDGKDLHISVTMPSIEVGTIGGGTQLASQSACLNLLGVKGASRESAGSNSVLLANIVAGSVLAGELSLMAAIAQGQLVKSHMKYNRSSKDISTVAS
ncbi:3-hydroxy-3-methylglutaryl-coenzyme A reductase 1-like [Populus alba x Populus x berolinensis]|uniref:3-hydroxy-3-methylglutaryl coenzyme A reductase n=1 Tax=Populus alba x Populus x berolinensis TaxID=444605 RepID=A0AAD6R008_9ROSI|nr:3-hydroxy-3-methylglutaryl-coenzyme A reductase 1-like [Populus alba x Populus x berolinensis]